MSLSYILLIYRVAIIWFELNEICIYEHSLYLKNKKDMKFNVNIMHLVTIFYMQLMGITNFYYSSTVQQNL